ncbi:AAA family ATPase [Pseudonocardia sp. McavD-2-B]|uniref:AAA family ATPase n=1 Tax=Pseudonocardia sp. McavD-2-B TaxID=2954499 RepID=UPI0020983B61|nr:AAA family ATPase [Pseudonocardia sp. McavD-2-B]MCO7193320.1 AAA family ATPase [Pseudonocardia sp. McavD-2-B]
MLRWDEPLPARPRRVVVAGVSGVGKTTLAARLAPLLGAPHTEIDALFHGPGWVPRPSFLDDVERLTAADAWVTEWQYGTARPRLSARADMLVWLDLPFWTVTFPRVLRRTWRRSRDREVLWNGNVEPPLRRLFVDRENILRWAVSTRHKYRALVPAVAQEHPALTVVRLRSPREVDGWVAGPLQHSLRGTRPF